MPPSLRLGKYIVEGILGPGGVTETYLAHLAPDAHGEFAPAMAGGLVALKLLRADCVAAKAYASIARRFLAAARQLRDFHRPGFGKVVDVSDDPAATFMVTEHVAGYDLVRVLEQSRRGNAEGSGIDPVLAGLIGAEIARILHVGHVAKPILCHLGLAPQNVMVTEVGEVVLLDFGIAAALRAVTEQPPERWTFVAPELQGVDCETAHLSDQHAMAADLYSLGAILHFLLTGQSPAVAPPRPLPASRTRLVLPDIPGVSSNLAAALRMLLAPEPEDRPPTAAVLVEWLAGGVDAVRDRQRFIALGLRAPTIPLPQLGSAPHALETRERLDPPPARTPGPSGAKGEVMLVARKPVARARLRRRGLLYGAFLVVALAALLTLRPRSVPNQTPRVHDREERRSQDVEMHPSPPSPEGEHAPAKRGEEARPAESSSGESVLSRVAGHLIAETVPPGAMVWVDGVFKGKTFADIVVGEGGHRIVLVAAGHRMFRDVVDTGKGAIIRRTLERLDPPTRGNGSIAVDCRTGGKFPILLDDEETGLLCPVKLLPTSAGKHLVGIFVPQERRSISVETTVEIGSKPAVVTFRE
ncbi:MAG TPA: protein kinase [Polyangia bacterium]